MKLAFVRLKTPVEKKWLEQLIKLGIDILQYYPDQSYLCRGNAEAFSKCLQNQFIESIGYPNPKLKSKVQIPPHTAQPVWVIIYANKNKFMEIANEFNNIAGVSIPLNQEIDACRFYLRVKATITVQGQENLLLQNDVLAIESYHLAVAKDEVSALVIAGQYPSSDQISYLGWLSKHNLSGKGVAVSVVDGGVYTNHPAFNDRVKDLTGGKKSWHGTFVAGHIAGNYLEEKDRQGFSYGVGLAPSAEIIAQSNNMPVTLTCFESVSNSGISSSVCTIQNNSWGLGNHNPMNYSSLESTFDLMVRNANSLEVEAKELTICFSAGNEGKKGLCRPCAAKNIIVTGNSKNYRPTSGGNEANNINDVFTGDYATGKYPSSQGNCGDGRIRPHIVAPGQFTAAPSYGLHIDRDSKNYISKLVGWSHGTSAASAHTAGACALLTEWWRKKYNGKTPSPAMLKALIVNAAVDTGFGGYVPNNQQGWGRLNIGNIIEANTKTKYVDQEITLTQNNEKKTWKVKIDDSTKPTKITLAWTDPPGAFGTGTEESSAIVNKLLLQVVINDQLYEGNKFEKGWSVPGEIRKEEIDNLQNVFLPSNQPRSEIIVAVIAQELWMNCFSGTCYPPKQDFSIVMSNCYE